MDDDSKPQEFLALTTEIVASFVGNNAVAMSDLPALIASVFQALRTTGQAEPETDRRNTDTGGADQEVGPA